MADKQQILSLALSDLVDSLTNPPCVDTSGAQSGNQPTDGKSACPTGTKRLHDPIDDIHIGILSSSLGGHGSDSCPSSETSSCNGTPNLSLNDEGHLISRADACGTTSVDTYDGKGFLAWDPNGEDSPPGESDPAALSTKIKTMVLGAGQIGCGFEAPMESWYRFLVDPEPYQDLVIENGAATPKGIDADLLQQRREFLRPDSLLAVLMLSDEDDCSIKEYGQYYFAAQVRDPLNTTMPFHLPRARQECSINPNDPCCRSCGQPQNGCPADPVCNLDPTLDALEDPPNLRCWDQKRRFGIDFLYPVDRYIQGLSSQTVVARNGDLVPNPIFSDLDPNDSITDVRESNMVLLAGLVGVPWQDIARDPSDLTKGYKNHDELIQSGTWDVIAGDSANYVPPTDPLMIQSVDPRTGTNPATGTALAPPGSSQQNPINGSEYTITQRDDLQYACIFPLATPRDCADTANLLSGCDCMDPANDNPLCAENPADGGNRTLQVAAKAYPGTRNLAILKGLGAQGVPASICPSQFDDPSKSDYAYRPAIRSLLERVQLRLKK